MLRLWNHIRRIAIWLLSMYMKQNLRQREMWAKMFNVLATGSAVGVGMKYLSDGNTSNDISVIYWAICAIMFHVFSLIALMDGDDERDDRN